MKVGTDGVLLGAWVALGAADRLLLDVGTGTVIALMLAQRSPAAGVTALDIDAACAGAARANADRSPWGGRVTTCCAPVQGVPAGGAVRSGGLQSALLRPFALLPPDAGAHRGTPYRRAYARRADRRRLPAACARGASGGHPAGGRGTAVPRAGAGRLAVAAADRVWSTPRSGVKRCLMEFVRGDAAEFRTDQLVIEEAPGRFTEEYRRLTGDFYLKF